LVGGGRELLRLLGKILVGAEKREGSLFWYAGKKTEFCQTGIEGQSKVTKGNGCYCGETRRKGKRRTPPVSQVVEERGDFFSPNEKKLEVGDKGVHIS